MEARWIHAPEVEGSSPSVAILLTSDRFYNFSPLLLLSGGIGRRYPVKRGRCICKDTETKSFMCGANPHLSNKSYPQTIDKNAKREEESSKLL